jgi:hypothetical protein
MRVSRRLFLTLAGVGLVAGCGSEADRINNLVFGAVQKDPLYLWRPAWATSVYDREIPLGGVYPEASARIIHRIQVTSLPDTATQDAVAKAEASGWVSRAEAPGYVKPIENSYIKLWVTFAASLETQSFTMEFSEVS